MKPNYSIILRAGLGFCVGIAGMIYIRNMPTETNKPQSTEIRTSVYTLKDVNNDQRVDYVQSNNGKRTITFAAPDKIEELRKEDAWFALMPRLPPIPSPIQDAANEVLRGELNASQKLESLLNNY